MSVSNPFPHKRLLKKYRQDARGRNPHDHFTPRTPNTSCVSVPELLKAKKIKGHVWELIHAKELARAAGSRNPPHVPGELSLAQQYKALRYQ